MLATGQGHQAKIAVIQRGAGTRQKEVCCNCWRYALPFPQKIKHRRQFLSDRTELRPLLCLDAFWSEDFCTPVGPGRHKL